MTQSTRRLLAALVTTSACALGALISAPAPTQAAPTQATPTPAAPSPAVTAPGAQRAAAPLRIKVLQYNIKFGQIGGLAKVARDIKRTGAQVVLVNEIDDRRSSGGPLQAAYLADRLGMTYVYDPNSRNYLGLRGNAVLTNLTIRSLRRYPLPSVQGEEPRGLLRVRLGSAGVRFDVWSTHLNPGPGRAKQADTVRSTIGDPTCATVLGGDMNTEPGSAEYRSLRRHLRDLWVTRGDGDGGTGAGGKRIDYLLYDKVAPVSVRVLPRRHSDHHGLLGVVEIDPARSC